MRKRAFQQVAKQDTSKCRAFAGKHDFLFPRMLLCLPAYIRRKPEPLVDLIQKQSRGGLNSHESIIIGDDIKITILGTKGQDVKIGIEAPEDVEIWREEIYENILEGRAE